jgi:hypothetical protein
MRRFLELCRSGGVGVGLVLFPDAAVSLGADYAYRFLHERTLATCAAEGVPCVDLLPRFAAVSDRFTLWASPLDAHPSVLANQIAADAILATFAPRWGRAVHVPTTSSTPLEERPWTAGRYLGSTIRSREKQRR